MCEPNHSIVQYPENRDDGSPTSPLLEPSIKSKVLELGKKVLGWLHFSKMGSGHSEVTRQLGTFSYLVPEETRYEAMWWIRQVVLDGPFRGKEYDKELALSAATDYARRVSIGSLTTLRQFLEASMRKTDRPYSYLARFLDELLNPKGRDYAVRRLLQALHPAIANNNRLLSINRFLGYRCEKSAVDTVIKVMLGITRKRQFLNTYWADDSSLWSPGQSI